MQETFAITFLTHNNGPQLASCLRDFFAKTQISELPTQSVTVHVLIQGCSTEYTDIIRNLCQNLETTYSVAVHVHEYAENLGLSKANNRLYELTKDDTYVLHMEDDWFAYETDPKWLQAALTRMQANPTLSTIALRKYGSEKEKWDYGWTRTIPYNCHVHPGNFNYANKLGEPIVWHVGSSEFCFRLIEHFLFTFNPVIRRNADYISAGVYPLPEFNDVENQETFDAEGKKLHNSYHWGWCEALTMEKIRHLNTEWLSEGVMVHYDDWKSVIQEKVDLNGI
jgi:hypothetical protein